MLMSSPKHHFQFLTLLVVLLLHQLATLLPTAAQAILTPPAASSCGGASHETLATLPWKAGVAREVITPDELVWLAGYGSKRVPEGKLHDLWAKAIVIEDHRGQRGVLITSDFQGVPKSMSDQVFEKLNQKFGLQRHQIMFTFSHNHCGPRLGDDLVDYYPVEDAQIQLIERYTLRMESLMVKLVSDAIDNLGPAIIRMGQGTTDFAVNRRNNREAEVPQMIAAGTPLLGPVDHSVPVLTINRQDGELSAIVFGYACHPTTLSFTQWCGDYPGFAQIAIEKQHPQTTAMFVNTCGGDQNPLPRRSVELCEKYGLMLADAVNQVLSKPLQSISPCLETRFELVDLYYQEVVARDELVTMSKDQNAIRARWANRMLNLLDAGERFPPSYPYPIHVWKLGNQLKIVGMGAETVVDYSLRFKQQYGNDTWVFGYVDDMIAYIPSRRVWEEGGYEGGSNLYEYGRPALRWRGDIEQTISRSVERLMTYNE